MLQDTAPIQAMQVMNSGVMWARFPKSLYMMFNSNTPPPQGMETDPSVVDPPDPATSTLPSVLPPSPSPATPTIVTPSSSTSSSTPASASSQLLMEKTKLSRKIREYNRKTTPVHHIHIKSTVSILTHIQYWTYICTLCSILTCEQGIHLVVSRIAAAIFKQLLNIKQHYVKLAPTQTCLVSPTELRFYMVHFKHSLISFYFVHSVPGLRPKHHRVPWVRQSAHACAAPHPCVHSHHQDILVPTDEASQGAHTQ